MRARLIKKDGRIYVELPPEFAQESEVELFQLRDGYYLLSLPLSVKQTESMVQKTELTAVLRQNEKQLLEKLLLIRFNQRTPKHLDRLLTSEEKKLLKTLFERRYVSIFSSNKYPDGVYNISDKIYPLLRTSLRSSVGRTQAFQQLEATKAEEISDDPFYNQLKKQGFAVLPEYSHTSELLRKQVRAGDIIGVRSFDGKTYAVAREYFSRLANIIRSRLKKESGVEDIARLCKFPPDGCRAVLAIMAERGEVLERKKNVFALV